MKTIYVKDLEKNQIITGETFAVYEVSKLEDKNGKPYFNVTIGDKTGKISGKIWSDVLEKIDKKVIKNGNLIEVAAKIDEYRGNLQINIQSVAAVDETELDDFMEKSEFDVDEMFNELRDKINKVEDKKIKKVLTNIINDEEVSRKMKYWPAAKSVHHDFRSGLLQHILEMIEISESLKRFYPDLDYSILTAGIVLHDLGKIDELTGGIGTSYTKVGSLIGHIVIGTQIFAKFAKDVLDENTFLHIQHLILTHHGEIQFGSPTTPATPEAIALSNIDRLSSKTRTAVKFVAEVSDGEEFSNYNRWLENTRLWKVENSKKLDKERELEAEPKPAEVEDDLDEDQLSLV